MPSSLNWPKIFNKSKAIHFYQSFFIATNSVKSEEHFRSFFQWDEIVFFSKQINKFLKVNKIIIPIDNIRLTMSLFYDSLMKKLD